MVVFALASGPLQLERQRVNASCMEAAQGKRTFLITNRLPQADSSRPFSTATVQKGRLEGDESSGGDFIVSPLPPVAGSAPEVGGSGGIAVRCIFLSLLS